MTKTEGETCRMAQSIVTMAKACRMPQVCARKAIGDVVLGKEFIQIGILSCHMKENKFG